MWIRARKITFSLSFTRKSSCEAFYSEEFLFTTKWTYLYRRWRGFTPFTRTKINYKTCNKRLNILIHTTVLLNSMKGTYRVISSRFMHINSTDWDNKIIHDIHIIIYNGSKSSFMLINEFINIIPFLNSLTSYQFLCQKWFNLQ